MTYFPTETHIPPTAENCCIQWRVIPTQIPLPAWREKCCRIFRHKNTFALPFSFTHLCLTNYAMHTVGDKLTTTKTIYKSVCFNVQEL
jgi:hypothetical protein